MNELLPMITERDGIPVTTSRAVAEQFGKRHDHVIRDIENIKAMLTAPDLGALTDPNLGSLNDADSLTTQFCVANFFKSEYKDAKGESRPYYIITKDGFTLLVMGYTGAKAMQFKIAYINAFNRMERLIRDGGVSAPAPALQSIERRLEALEQATGAQTADISEVGATFLQAIRAAIDSGEYYIKQKYKPYKGKHGILLGTRGRTETAVKTLLAYKIYSEYASHPLSRMALWGLLERNGIILEREGLPYTVSFGDGKCGAIYIKNEKLEGKF